MFAMQKPGYVPSVVFLSLLFLACLKDLQGFKQQGKGTKQRID